MTQLRTLGLAFCACALLAGPVQAGDPKKTSDHEAARAALNRHEILPLTRILALAAQRAPGDVIKVELEQKHDKMIYELKVLGRDGRVREVELDARTGAVLSVEDD